MTTEHKDPEPATLAHARRLSADLYAESATLTANRLQQERLHLEQQAHAARTAGRIYRKIEQYYTTGNADHLKAARDAYNAVKEWLPSPWTNQTSDSLKTAWLDYHARKDQTK